MDPRVLQTRSLDVLSMVIFCTVDFLPAYEAHGVVRNVSRACRDSVQQRKLPSHVTSLRPHVTLTRCGDVRWDSGLVVRPCVTYRRGHRGWVSRVHDKNSRTSSSYVVVGKRVRIRTFSATTDVLRVNVWDRHEGT